MLLRVHLITVCVGNGSLNHRFLLESIDEGLVDERLTTPRGEDNARLPSRRRRPISSRGRRWFLEGEATIAGKIAPASLDR